MTNTIRVCSNFHGIQVIDLNDPERIELYGRVSLLTIIAWACYPLVWLLGTGFGGIGVSVEVSLDLTESAFEVVLQNSIPTQIRQLILDYN